MFDLTLTPEQLEMRDTLRDFAQREMKAAAIHPDRLQPFEKPVMTNLLTGAAQLGIRTLALSEEAGGAGADNLTTCIVLEELASEGFVGLGIDAPEHAAGPTLLTGRIQIGRASCRERV